jgi:transposase
VIAFGHQVSVSHLFGPTGRKLLDELEFPEPWAGHLAATRELIDELEVRIATIERELRHAGADHRYVPLLMSAPGIRVDHRVHDRRRDRGDREMSTAPRRAPRGP